ncbi:unnamed protein product [Rhodiola kirilowii]
MAEPSSPVEPRPARNHRRSTSFLRPRHALPSHTTRRPAHHTAARTASRRNTQKRQQPQPSKERTPPPADRADGGHHDPQRLHLHLPAIAVDRNKPSSPRGG